MRIWCTKYSSDSSSTVWSPDACRASSPALTLEKRVQIFSIRIGSYQYTCNTDQNGNPYADCLNTISKICDRKDSDYRAGSCREGVDRILGGTSPSGALNRQNVRKFCGQWSWNGFTGNKEHFINQVYIFVFSSGP